ncbi:protein kinase domain-containing protein, partial [Nocardia gipuzkoensis]
YLADFGIARSDGDTGITLAGTAVGSYTYMAPERFDAGAVTGQADIYSLACVLHECLTGATPFPVQSVSVLIRSHLSEPPPRPSLERPDVPQVLDAVIAHAMAKSPADRFATAGEFAGAAQAALGLSAEAEPAAADSPPVVDKLFLFGEPLAADSPLPGANPAARPVRSLLGPPPVSSPSTPAGPVDPTATTFLPTGPGAPVSAHRPDESTSRPTGPTPVQRPGEP